MTGGYGNGTTVSFSYSKFKVGGRTGGITDKRDTGQEECWTGGMSDRRDEGQEG